MAENFENKYIYSSLKRQVVETSKLPGKFRFHIAQYGDKWYYAMMIQSELCNFSTYGAI